MCGGMAVASFFFFSFALAPLIEDDPAWRGWPFPESPGSRTWAMLPGRPEVRKSIHDCCELATGGPRQLPQALQHSLEERRLQTLWCVSAKTVPKTQRHIFSRNSLKSGEEPGRRLRR